MLKDFRNFVMKGNVADLAVGFILGAAFSKIVGSLVEDVIMPIVGAIFGGLDFTNYYIPLSSAVQGHPAYADAKKLGAVLGYGSFISTILNFLVIALVLFLIIRQVEESRKPATAAPEAPPAPPRSEALLEEIRDALLKGR